MLTPRTPAPAGDREPDCKPTEDLLRRAARRASRPATTLAPSLLKPIRLIRHRSRGSRNIRGAGLPGCACAVTVPISTKAKPSAARPSMPSAFLSKPAARPKGPGNSRPSALTRSAGSSLGPSAAAQRRGAPGTAAAARIAPKPRWCARSGSMSLEHRAEQGTVDHQLSRASRRALSRAACSCSEPTPIVPAQQGLDALHGRGEPLHRRDARLSGGDGGGADLVAVEPRADAVGRVDDQVDVAVHDALDDRGLAVRAPRPRAACARSRRGSRCAAAPPRCPRWPGSRSRGRPAPSPGRSSSACPGWPPRRRPGPWSAARRRPRPATWRRPCRSRRRCP
jgi:hypothetical protein